MQLTESFVREERDNSFLVYVFENESCFDEIGFRAMKSSDGDVFVKNAVSIFNSERRIIYNTEGCVPVLEYLRSFGEDKIRSLIECITDNSEKISENGFLSMDNVPACAERIYVCPDSGEVKFIYIPAIHESHENPALLCMKIISEIFRKSHLAMPESERFDYEGFGFANIRTIFSGCDKQVMDTKAEEQNIKEKYYGIFNRRKRIVKDIPAVRSSLSYENKNNDDGYVLYLNGFNGCEQLSFEISDSAVIGRKESRSDYIISNSVVSSAHCRIYRTPENEFYVADLDSTNGTAVNSSGKLKPHTGYKLHSGDMLHISRISLEVSIMKKGEFVL